MNNSNSRPIYIFAYGSNLLTSRLRQRVSTAVKFRAGELGEYTLVFHKRGVDGSGKADIVHTGNPSDRVAGVVFAIHESQIDELDSQEPGYDRIPVSVVSDHGRMQAEAYQARRSVIDESLLPFDWYIGLIEAGAREHGLPAEYCRRLAAAPSIPDPDAKRRRVHESLLRETPSSPKI